jgi:hypothetical protein
MKTKLPASAFLALSLGACSTAQLQTAQTDITNGQVVVDTAACDLQKAANDATTVANAAGDSKVAAIATATSVAAGATCMTLAAPAATPAS